MMSVAEKIEALKAQHQALETALEQESKRPKPDDAQIHDLKKQKLRIKDMISALSS